jgi:hypothetical protein
MEESIYGDYSLIKGWKADKAGNVQFRKTANNFNQAMAKASKITICEVINFFHSFLERVIKICFFIYLIKDYYTYHVKKIFLLLKHTLLIIFFA